MPDEPLRPNHQRKQRLPARTGCTRRSVVTVDPPGRQPIDGAIVLARRLSGPIGAAMKRLAAALPALSLIASASASAQAKPTQTLPRSRPMLTLDDVRTVSPALAKYAQGTP